MTFYHPANRSTKEVLPGFRIRTFWGSEHMLSLVELDAGTVLPRHSHPHEQSTYVLEGELSVEISGETRLLQAGELMIIPGGVEHHVTVGSSGAKVMDVFVPAREDFTY